MKKLLESMYENKLINLMDSGFELSWESEAACKAHKNEIIERLLPMLKKCMDSSYSNDSNTIENLYGMTETSAYDTIFDYDNIWRNAIYDVFKSKGIDDELLSDYFETDDELQKHIFKQWQV